MADRAYYNEIDRDAAHVLRCLIADGLIAPGDVDDRSIKDVQPDDLAGYTQCHFFAGAGLWSVAARLAGWPDARPIWSASCPCQPFSAAGKGLGVDDPRHLWPNVDRLVRGASQRGFGPSVLVGEQVAGSPGYHWFNGVRADLAQQGYRARVVDIPACAVDAPNIRQRLYWCALADSAGAGRLPAAQPGVRGEAQGERSRDGKPERLSGLHGLALADAGRGGDEPWLRSGESSGTARPYEGEARERERCGDDDRLHAGRLALGDTTGERRGEGRPEHELRSGWSASAGADASGNLAQPERGRSEGRDAQWPRPSSVEASARPNGSAWAGADWIICHDGKARRTEPGLRLLVDGMAGRVPAWRLGGNSINPVLAAEVIAALMDALDLERTAA